MSYITLQKKEHFINKGLWRKGRECGAWRGTATAIKLNKFQPVITHSARFCKRLHKLIQ